MGTAQEDDQIPSEYLTFSLGTEEYAIDILNVEEIRGYEPPTQIAQAPTFIKGVIDLRGTIIPIVDLRIKFNISNVQYTPSTVVIILNMGNRLIGAVVDSVSDVIPLTTGQIRPAPEFSGRFDTTYLLGLATIDKRMLIVTNIERLLSSAEMQLIETAHT